MVLKQIQKRRQLLISPQQPHTRSTRLHCNELCPAIPLGAELHHGELVRPHGARTNVSDLAAPDEIIQRLHRLLHRGVGVEAMDPK